jgi:hypothetical protein
MFGDVDSIVLTMMPEQIATSRFAEAELHRGFCDLVAEEGFEPPTHGL